MNPITGVTGCCARAASGHTVAELAASTMNERRFIACTSMPNLAFNPVHQNRKVGEAKPVDGAAMCTAEILIGLCPNRVNSGGLAKVNPSPLHPKQRTFVGHIASS